MYVDDVSEEFLFKFRWITLLCNEWGRDEDILLFVLSVIVSLSYKYLISSRPIYLLLGSCLVSLLTCSFKLTSTLLISIGWCNGSY